MANLPSVPRENAVTPQITSRVTPADIARPYDTIGSALDSLGGAISTKAADYQRMVDQGAVARENDAAKTAALNLENEANGDAGAFQTSWDAYTQSRLPNLPASQRATVELNLLTIGGDTYRGILSQKFNQDRTSALKSIDARNDTLIGTMTDLASAGQTGSDAYKQAHDEFTGNVKEKVGNPAFGYSQAEADLYVGQQEDKLTGAAVTGDLERTYAKGGLVAAQQRADEILNDQSSPLSQIQKYKAVQAGISGVRSLYSVDVQSRSEFNAAKDSAVAALADGTLSPDDPFVAQLTQTADALKDPVAKLAIATAQGRAYLNPMKSMSLHDGLNFLHDGGGQGGDLNAAAGDVIKKEEGLQLTPFKDNDGKYRQGYSSDYVLGPDGKPVPVSASSPAITQAQADAELNREVPQYAAGIAGLVGQDAWARLPVKAQGALVSVAYNYGSLDKHPELVTAIKTGDLGKIADAVSALGKNAGVNNPARRDREAAIIRGATGPGGPLAGYVKGVIPDAIANVKTELDSALTQADAQVAKFPLADSQVADLVQAARYVNDDATYARVNAIIAKSDGTARQLGTPIGDHTQMLAQMRSGAVGTDAFAADMLGAAEATNTRMLNELKTDARGVGVEQGLFKPGPAIDWTNLGAELQPGYSSKGAAVSVGAVLQQRASQAGSMETYNKLPANSVNVLRPNEAADLVARLTASQDPQALLQNVEKAAGNAWPRVLSDLVTLGKLPAEYQSVASLDDAKDAALLARGLNEVKPKADGTPGRTWDDILGTVSAGKGVAATIRETIRTDPTVMQFERSLSASGASAGQVDNIVSSIETLAFAKQFYSQDKTAAQDAIKSFTGNYRFLDSGARVPAKYYDATMSNARAVLQTLSPQTVAVPPVFGQQGGPTADEYLNGLRANPTWVTSPKEDALWLMDSQGRFVRDTSGNPLAVPFTDKVSAPGIGGAAGGAVSDALAGRPGPLPSQLDIDHGTGAAAPAAPADGTAHMPDIPAAKIQAVISEDVFNALADGGIDAAIAKLNQNMTAQGITGRDADQFRVWFTSHFGTDTGTKGPQG